MSLKHLAYRTLSRARRAVSAPAREAGLRVLMYHSVGGAVPGNPYGISISKTLFKEHLRRLVARAEFAFRLFGRPHAGRRELSLTFDDGFRDTLTEAAPVCQDLGLPLTVFVTPKHVREHGALYLTLAELKELAKLPNVLVGAHGNTHTPLDALDDKALAAELSDSRKFLEDAVGKPVTTLSYPHGRVDQRVRDAAEKAGYTEGGCSRYGVNAPERDPLLLCRTEITAWDSVGDLDLKVEGHWDWFAHRHPDPAQ